MRSALLALLLAPWGQAQEVVHELNNTGQNNQPGWAIDALTLVSISDLDGDGFRDLLCGGTIFTSVWRGLVVLSGVTHEPIWALPFSTQSAMQFRINDLAELADLDGDGRRELGCITQRPALFDAPTLLPFSPARFLPLWSLPGAGFNNGYDILVGSLMTQVSGSPDILAIVTYGPTPRVDVLDGQGQLRYSIPYSIFAGPISGAVLGDLDGDGADDFVIGVTVTGPTYTGELHVYSGRTGARIRMNPGQTGFDNLGHSVANVGDIDLDGVSDYAGGCSGGHWVPVYSGATGAMLHQWRSPTGGDEIGGYATFGRDVDLDGIPDLVTGAPFATNNGNFNWKGRVLAYSGRDGVLLWELFATPGNSSLTYFGENLADLGVQPGSPYPVFVLSEAGWQNLTPQCCPFGRFLWVRTSLPGAASQHGAGCASSGDVPLIGFRRDGGGAYGGGLRLTVSGTPPGAQAWLAIGSSRTQFGTTPLPMSLAPLGLSGCNLLVSPDNITTRTTGTVGIDSGYAYVDFRGEPSTRAPLLFAQWIVLGQAASGPYYATTAAQEFRLR